MYHIYSDKSYKKKIRGKTRKFNTIKSNLIEQTSVFPEIDLEYGFWHLHMPTSKAFIDSYTTPVSLRRKFIELKF